MFRNVLSTTCKNFQIVSVRYKQKKFPKIDKKLQAAAESLASRGFLRPNKPWNPPEEIDKTILKICAVNGLKEDSEFDSLDVKYTVLKACFDETGHGIPNSMLHTIETVDDLMEFYETPVDTLTPFDSLKKMDLPKNLHVQEDYVRFHPEVKELLKEGLNEISAVSWRKSIDHIIKEENKMMQLDGIMDAASDGPDKDTLFNGKTVFPKSSTIVSGLKTRKKYEGYTAKTSWP